MALPSILPTRDFRIGGLTISGPLSLRHGQPPFHRRGRDAHGKHYRRFTKTNGARQAGRHEHESETMTSRPPNKKYTTANLPPNKMCTTAKRRPTKCTRRQTVVQQNAGGNHEAKNNCPRHIFNRSPCRYGTFRGTRHGSDLAGIIDSPARAPCRISDYILTSGKRGLKNELYFIGFFTFPSRHAPALPSFSRAFSLAAFTCGKLFFLYAIYAMGRSAAFRGDLRLLVLRGKNRCCTRGRFDNANGQNDGT